MLRRTVPPRGGEHIPVKVRDLEHDYSGCGIPTSLDNDGFRRPGAETVATALPIRNPRQ